METWEKIPAFEKYKVSDTGRVITTDYKRMGIEKEMIGTICKKRGYKRVTLTKNGKSKTFFIHYLVCLTFYGERPPGKQIDHIDGNKLNNKIENLEYVTQKVNIQRAYQKGIYNQRDKNQSIKIGKPILKIDKGSGEVISLYKTITEAGKEIGKRGNLIGEVCRGQRKTAYGFFWKFL